MVAIVIVRYQPAYEVTIDGMQLGYIENSETLIDNIKKQVISENEYNIEYIDVNLEVEYELQLISRTIDMNTEEIENKIKEAMVLTYKYYDIVINEEIIVSVDTIEEAEELVGIANGNGSIDGLAIIENYTQEETKIATTEIEIARTSIVTNVETVVANQEAIKAEEARIAAMPQVNGIKIAATPVQGIVTSRYGAVSSLWSESHTGLDIAATTGTPIYGVADGVITFAGYNGSYGYMIIIDHGNDVETWYAHCSKLYVSLGQSVTGGQMIAAVGSTGNSTGAHLHLEVRVNGEPQNPQIYLYN